MKTSWFRGIKTKEEQETFRKLILGSQKVIDKLDEIVYNKIIELEKNLIVDYDSPNWAYRQADKNGELRALKFVRELLEVQTED